MISKFKIFESNDERFIISEIDFNTKEYIKDSNIHFDNIEEMINICKILLSLGFEVFNSTTILNGSNSDNWTCFYFESSKNLFSRSKTQLGKTIKYENLINIIGKENIKRVKINTIKRPEFDPYQEEDWGYTIESTQNDPLYISDSALLFDSEEEAVQIAKELIERGYKVYQYPSKEFYDGLVTDWNCFIKYQGAFTPARRMSYKSREQITFDEFMERISKNFKRIKNTELDPYDEEDWGYSVQVQEGKRNFKEKKLFIRDPIESFKDLNINDAIASLRGSKITHRLKKEIGNHYVQFENDRGAIYKSLIKDVRIKFEPSDKSVYYYNKRFIVEDVKIGKVKIFFDIPHERYGWNQSVSIKLGQSIIIYELKRIYKDIDPYGEEEWEI